MASLCSVSQRTVSETQNHLANNEFVSVYLVSEVQIQSEVNATIETFKRQLSNRIISFLNYLRIVARANFFITALNTNAVMILSNTEFQFSVIGFQVVYDPATIYNSIDAENLPCSIANPTSPAGFFSFLNNTSIFAHTEWYKPTLNSTLVNGFFVGCTPLEALLQSTLDCLYDVQCLQLLTEYFSALKQVCITISHLFFQHLFLLLLYLDELELN